MLTWLPDRTFIRIMYRACFGKRIDLVSPQTFNEKLQWLKLYNRKPIYTLMVDKYRVREYIANRIGSEYLIPLLGVWNNPEDIDFEKLPDQFVLKCNHDSGSLFICKDKSKIDVNAIKAKLKKALKRNYYSGSREWPYKNVKPCIIAEKLMIDESTSELRDYKFFCFNGVCKCFKVDFDRFTEHHANYYDRYGKWLDFGEAICPPVKTKNIVLPEELEKMIELAETLSKDEPFLRVDFYVVNGKIYFGELTLFPASGFGPFIPEDADLTLGSWIHIPDESSGLYAS